MTSTVTAADLKQESYLTISYRTATVDGIKIFYREAGDPNKPVILLLHGFPSSSHMFRDIMSELADRFHLVAPDYPGFGYSDAPGSSLFEPTFDNLATVIEHFIQHQDLLRFSLYMQDFGGPVGFRLALRHPEWIESLIVQNANAYDEGIAPSFREACRQRALHPATEEELSFDLSPDGAAFHYHTGARDVASMSPDALAVDLWCMEQGGHRRIAAALLNDYQTNIDSYPKWHAYLRVHQPRTLVVWGKGDPIFLVPGAEAYKKDLPNADIHLLNTSHFALEEDSWVVAGHIKRFLRTPSSVSR